MAILYSDWIAGKWWHATIDDITDAPRDNDFWRTVGTLHDLRVKLFFPVDRYTPGLSIAGFTPDPAQAAVTKEAD